VNRGLKDKKLIYYLQIIFLITIVFLTPSIVTWSGSSTVADVDLYKLDDKPNITEITFESNGIKIKINNFDNRPFLDPDENLTALIYSATVLYIDLDNNTTTGFNGTSDYGIGTPLDKTPNLPLGTDIIVYLEGEVYSRTGEGYYYLDPLLAFYPNGTVLNIIRSPALTVYDNISNMTDYLQLDNDGIWLGINWTYIYDVYMNVTNIAIDKNSAIIYLYSKSSYKWRIFPFGNTFTHIIYVDDFNNILRNRMTLRSLELELDGNLTEWTDDYLLGIDNDKYPTFGAGFEKIYAAANDTHLMLGIQLDNSLLGSIRNGDINYEDFLTLLTTISNETSSYTLEVRYDAFGFWSIKANGTSITSYSIIKLNNKGNQIEIAINISAINDPNIFTGEGVNISLESAWGTTGIRDALYVPYDDENMTYLIYRYNLTSNKATYEGISWFYQKYAPGGSNITFTDQNIRIIMNLSSSTVFYYGYSPINLASLANPPSGKIHGYYYFSVRNSSNLIYPVIINVTVANPTSNIKVYYYNKYTNKYTTVPDTNIIRGNGWIKILFDEDLYNKGDPVFLLSYTPTVGGELVENKIDHSLLIYEIATFVIFIVLVYYLRLMK